ncbi:MAG: phytanoyl-CoA dioxygenase family protein [Balneolaceae bacterium]
MKDSIEYKKKYDSTGYLFLSDFLGKAEIEVILNEIPVVKKYNPDAVILEKSGEVRSVFVETNTNKVIDSVVENHHISQIVKKLLGSDIYPYQIKFNNKCAFLGEPWEWHQDFVFWHREDGMPLPKALSIAIFLSDINEFNGPIYLVPSSHKNGILELQEYDEDLEGESSFFQKYQNSRPYISQVSSKLKYSLDKTALRKVIDENGLVSMSGGMGSILFFDSNLVHSSPSNLSPWDRNILFITYNSVNNLPPLESMKRPSFIANKYEK